MDLDGNLHGGGWVVGEDADEFLGRSPSLHQLHQLPVADETGYAFHSVRQYLGGGRRSVRFKKKALAVLETEEVRQKTATPVPPQWNLIFATEEQFNRVDRASRIVDAESFTDFCREVILAKADEILEKKKRAVYPKMKPLPPARVAEEPEE